MHLSLQASDYSVEYFNILESCHVIIIAVNPNDTNACIDKINEFVHNEKKIPIFVLQRGVKSSTAIKDE